MFFCLFNLYFEIKKKRSRKGIIIKKLNLEESSKTDWGSASLGIEGTFLETFD